MILIFVEKLEYLFQYDINNIKFKMLILNHNYYECS